MIDAGEAFGAEASDLDAGFACIWEGHGDTIARGSIRWCPTPDALTLKFQTHDSETSDVQEHELRLAEAIAFDYVALALAER
jgi:hypothetical protein